MDEAKFRAEIGRLIQARPEKPGLSVAQWPITQTDAGKCPNCGTLVRPKKSRPDIMCLNPVWDTGPAIVIECKMCAKGLKWVDSSFAFSRLDSGQRRWLTNYAEDTPEGGPWPSAYLALCLKNGRAGAKNDPRLAWLVPWQSWLQVESRLADIGRKSIPLTDKRRLHRRKALRKRGLFMLLVLKDWELIWYRGNWQLPGTHPLYVGRYLDLRARRARWEDDT